MGIGGAVVIVDMQMTKLMWALGQNMNPEQVKDLFEKSLAGEITENPDETGK